ncbi:hypothetical protein HBH56_074700 [Parastagonospora nodorum]|uniref:Lipocalin-like domain-containing protein n=2 Tax=Phaeosphaeria nodorum (strain SN15 / ATCC MYA-4574 / FGSC 10173) TaxID=321614 RepID=A0A7U2IBK4_PHANO|nr:hypothetical protein SNOG_13687 [Parastagonospora nodorum SN15]KAH3915471.1 hypothetical protein HBH56_074700 [Parastagonospora nodorum]EAT79134.1 hypothetical protein SNOG_13687 [Parastagonospora nodorum SN15]KAH3927509.1 hypothetical protein HBH54_154940 [Parastagonospora nodorum]KAH3952114.1 hypothetical protein HBH53_053410 [Parastagonospora nodorum]KAH3981814.1 hypothetical protein HBH51_041690 [Parastagonospora nodorum]
MAAPPSKTLQSLSGNWKLNKSCSDDFASVLALQGVGLLVRKAATAASIHLKITQSDEQHIKMAQSVTSGKIAGTTEDYTLDWEWRSNKDAFFGDVAGRSRWVSVEEGEKSEVVGAGGGGWIEGDSSGKLVEAQGKKESGQWEAHHLWGFEIVDGERRHTRRVYVKNNEGEELRVRMVYDFVEE